MNTIIEESGHQILHGALDAQEQRAVDALVDQHRGNMAMTQQLALDASRLVSTSEARLRTQADAGFCKRLLGAISGRTTRDALANQGDALKMQKIAWHVLQQLQQQNLINTQAIAVIRNNLGTMNDFIIETRDFLDLAIDKINHRLRHVENNARLTKWSLAIEANKRRFRSVPASMLVVQLSFDFLLRHSDVELTYEDINHLLVTLEGLGINCDEQVRLLDFIMELIDQIDVVGIDHYQRAIQLLTEGHKIEPAFVQSNVSGLGFNALYYLEDQHARIAALINDDELCDSDSAREKIISRIFGDAFDGLATTYTLRDLVSELVGGGLLAIAIYRDRMGLDAPPVQEVLDAPVEETLLLVSQLPEIHAHSALDAMREQDDRRDYIASLALVLEDARGAGRLAREFIEHLAVRAGTPEAVGAFASVAADPRERRVDLNRLNGLLADNGKVYCWLLDAFFLLALEQRTIETTQVMQVLSVLKPERLKELLPSLQAIIAEEEPQRILDACTTLSNVSRGWANVLCYRELRFGDMFTRHVDALETASLAASMLSLEFIAVTRKAMEVSYFVGRSTLDDSLFGKFGNAVNSTACAMGRKSALAALNQLRGKVAGFVSTHASVLYSANAAIGRFGFPTSSFDNACGHADFDMDNAAENEDWSEQFDHHVQRLEQTLREFGDACDDAVQQLALFGKGDFTRSILEARERARQDARQRREEEALEKRSVRVIRDGVEHQFTIEWEDVHTPPCDPETIRYLRTNGTRWLIGTAQGTYFASSDRVEWQQVHPFGDEERTAREILLIDSVWIMTSYNDRLAYSADGVVWETSKSPLESAKKALKVNNTGIVTVEPEHLSCTDDIVRLDGLWIWRVTRYRTYRYTEKGFFRDSESTSTYTESLLVCAPSLDAEWARWEGSPSLAEGMQVDSLHAMPGVGSLLLFCSRDWSYERDRKLPEEAPQVKYYVPGKGWRSCTWNGDTPRRPTVLVTRMQQRLLCFSDGQLLTSDKGYAWTAVGERLRTQQCFHLDGLSVFPSWSDSELLLVTQDGTTFKELKLESGTWNQTCLGMTGALSVYAPNPHETWLRVGTYAYHPVA